jgi:acyl-CoA oxidase
MVTDPILTLDAAMVTILLAHVGLTIGTLARHLHRRPDLEPLVNRLLRFNTVCYRPTLIFPDFSLFFLTF